ncbi:MAG TPA: histidinol-phosphate transaminase [Clostridiaceae bacterium]|nr:histidinol-phosphate transaminase [Clostridiaceae bacterium]
MSRYWSDIVSKLEPYVPGEQPKDKKYIKLNTNENPYPPSPKVLEAIKNACNSDIRLYPDPECDILRKTIAEYFNLEKEQVFVGNGSDELLAFSFMAFFNPGKPIFFPDITYSFYPVYSQIFNIDYKLVELDEEFSVPVDKFLEKNGGIILPNPNAPTGKFLPIESIEIILSGNPDSVVIIDEAYIDFGGESASRLINEFPNLLVIQTLSKSRSLAGLRLGFALGNKKLTEGLDRVKNSFNSYTIDRLALAGAEK